MSNWIYGHDFMGEMEIDGRRYFLKSIQFEEFTDSGHQTWMLEEVDTGRETELEYMPNQKHRRDHELKVRQMISQAQQATPAEMIKNLRDIVHNPKYLRNGLEKDVGDDHE